LNVSFFYLMVDVANFFPGIDVNPDGFHWSLIHICATANRWDLILSVDIETLASQIKEAQKVVLRGVRRWRNHERPLTICGEARSKGREIVELTS